MSNVKILWADDEIDLLKPQLFFLEKKGYQVETVSNGYDALDVIQNTNDIDIVFLDESMPGITGLETLEKIKEINNLLPIVMITKNEEEDIMEQAIGSQIQDYLIKPVNPNQILLTIKKIIDNNRLVSEKTSTDYQIAFRQLSMDMDSISDYEGWVDFYKKIIGWELKLSASDTKDMAGILEQQKKDANQAFFKFMSKNYESWFENEQRPIMSHDLLRNYLFPELNDDVPTIFLLLDNLRFDQWKTIEPILLEQYNLVTEKSFYSSLPTATQYSRNAIFAGMTPSDIEKNFKNLWKNDYEEGGKNNHEKELLQSQLDRVLRRNVKMQYTKVTNVNHAKQLEEKILESMNQDLYVIVYNFIDTLSHARTEMDVLKELAVDEKAYRSLTKSWFINSPLWSALKKLEGRKFKLCIGTDHGTIRVNTPSRVVADRNTTTNLRYKVGRNLKYESRDVLDIQNPTKVGLPKPNMSSRFIFAKEDCFFLYPNNFNYYNNMYGNSFQHGGISLEEVICPFIVLESK